MKPALSRRSFLTAGLALSAAGLGERAAGAQGTAQDTTLTFRTLGKTGLKVTSLSFGCMTTSDQSVVERAADLGIIHFDTARSYMNGNNERMVGAALKGRRKQVVLSSKSRGTSRQELLDELDTSLRELETDYLDIWYLHEKNTPASVTDDMLEAQRIARKAGKIRFAGVSTHFNMDQMLAHLVKLGQTDVVLTTYNFTMRNVAMADQPARAADMTMAIREARKAGMGIVAMKAMAGGVERVGRGDRLYGAPQESVARRPAGSGRAAGRHQVGSQERIGGYGHRLHARHGRTRRGPAGHGRAVHREGPAAARRRRWPTSARRTAACADPAAASATRACRFRTSCAS